MTKASKATFEWDPNADQTYSDDADLTLPRIASAFNKTAGTSFTMDAPKRKLTLQLTPSTTHTLWGEFNGSPPETIIDVKRGTLEYDARNSEYATLLFLATGTLTVENEGRFVVWYDSIADGSGVQLQTEDSCTINVKDQASLTSIAHMPSSARALSPSA
jgi:hypothetical protein